MAVRHYKSRSHSCVETEFYCAKRSPPCTPREGTRELVGGHRYLYSMEVHSRRLDVAIARRYRKRRWVRARRMFAALFAVLCLLYTSRTLAQEEDPDAQRRMRVLEQHKVQQTEYTGATRAQLDAMIAAQNAERAKMTAAPAWLQEEEPRARTTSGSKPTYKKGRRLRLAKSYVSTLQA